MIHINNNAPHYKGTIGELSAEAMIILLDVISFIAKHSTSGAINYLTDIACLLKYYTEALADGKEPLECKHYAVEKLAGDIRYE